MAAAVLAVSFASCSKENAASNGNADEGAPTYVGISFTIPATGSAVTRADQNAGGAEAAFKFVDVFIYNTASGAQATHARIPASEFTGPAAGANTDEWTAKTSAKIATSTGGKTIFVGVNLSATLSAALDGVPMGEFTNVAQSIDVADVTGASDGFAMFSTAPKTVTLVADATQNNVKVQVQRLVAKVTVQKSETMTVNGPGSVDNLMFVLNNTNKKTFYVQPADKKDHNWDSTPAGDLADGNSDYIGVNAFGVAVKDLSPKYCLENTTKDFLMGQITRATVRATFVPDQVKEFANGTDNAAGYVDQNVPAATAPATFYAVSYNSGANKAYFFDPAVAASFAADNIGDIATYNDGYCYWDMFLNPDNTDGSPYDVIRNDFYRCNITKIVAPGRPTPEVTDPTIPPAQSTDLLVDIEIIYWNPIEKDYILEP